MIHSEWPIVPLANICCRISSGGTPSRANPSYFVKDGHLWVKSKELLDGPIYMTEETISDEALAHSSAKYFPEGTILLAMYGATVGQLGMLRRMATVNQAICGLVVDETMSCHNYVFYALLHMRHSLIAKAFGAAQQNLNQELIRSFGIPLPPLPIQRKIAAIVSAYDYLIENNTRRIALLEAMAQALYREWFVRFRFPGHESVPLVDSPLGPIPEGWRVAKLGDVVELSYGKALTSDERHPGEVPVFGSSGIVGYHDAHLVDGPGIIVGRKGNVGSVFWSEAPFYPIDTVYFVRTALPLHYVFFNLREQGFINNDAAVPGLNRNQAYSLTFLIPSAVALAQFEDFMTSTFIEVKRLTQTNANLRQTRDLLLPKLVSGELDVTDLEVAMGE